MNMKINQELSLPALRERLLFKSTPDTREFNRALETADARCPFELEPEALYAWLRSKGLTVTAHELREAGEAVGYFRKEKAI